MQSVTIRWGAFVEVDEIRMTYEFESEPEKRAFLYGVDESSAWMDYDLVEEQEVTESVGDASLYQCDSCGGTNVQACLPGFFDANNNFAFCEFDTEAETLYWLCANCEDRVVIIKPTGDTERGRW